MISELVKTEYLLKFYFEKLILITAVKIRPRILSCLETYFQLNHVNIVVIKMNALIIPISVVKNLSVKFFPISKVLST